MFAKKNSINLIDDHFILKSILFSPEFIYIYINVYMLGNGFLFVCLFVCLFVALRPKSTAMVIAGRSVHLTTLFPGQA